MSSTPDTPDQDDQEDDYGAWKREEIAQAGTLAAVLSTMLDERDEDGIEHIVLFDRYNDVIGEYSSLADLPAVNVYQRFYAWSENWVYHDHGGADPSRPAAMPRHPANFRDTRR